MDSLYIFSLPFGFVEPMHSSVASISMVLPLQVICIFMILVGAHSSGQVAKPGCRDRCGNLSIPYPFGIGSDCSLDPSFYISCNTSTDPPEAYLSAIDKHLQVLEINQTYVRVKYPILVSVCYDLSAYEPAGTDSSNLTAPQSYKHSMNVDLSGTPYSLSVANSITAIGCDDMVFGIDQLKDSYLTGGCSAICTDSGNTDGHGVGFCPVNDTLIGNGCCRAPIFGALTVKDKYSLGAELVDLSSKLARRKLFPCSYAFIQEEIPNATVFSYPLHYLHNATAFLDDNWASASRPPVVRLDWSFGSENCSRAQLNFTTYACRDNKSVCVDEVDDYLITTGYICRCVQGYEGNPYLPGGCKPISFSSSVAKPGCQDQCGKLSIPFPFGMGPNCFLAPSFEVICNTSTNPPIAYLSILNTEIIELNSSKVSVKYPNQPGYVCYNYSDYSRVSKTEERSLMIDLSTTQYTLSGENSITTVGCDDMLVGVIGQGNRSFMGSACASVCSDRRDSIIRGELIQDAAFCPSVESPGDGCCRAPIPPGTSYLEANLMDISGEWPVVFSCSYAFFQLNRNPESNLSPQIQRLSIYNSTEVLMETEGEIELALDWRVGNLNCKQAQLVNSTSFACQANTDCIDFDATTTVGGYLCNCSRGFQGNPYLASGCQDIDECADNPCVPNAICSNTIGSFYCSCKKGYFGDGTKDGKGCIQRPETKTIILIGMGSGLGFLLILVMLFWLYKLLQKRRAIMLREKFFKRNGGLLLRQQTNEGALGKTKVFPSKELEIATDNFNESRILGQGGQGTVYKGMLSDGKIVAVKKSKLVEENQLEQFINEVVILSQINHRNVVQLLGCCLETEVPLLVYEFMPNGTLYELIHDPNNEFAIPWNMRLKIAADIAGALAYLHSASSMPIYHRDIKSSNILLDEKYVVKVSDFGTSRSVDVDQTHLTTLVKGTFGYLDPEYFQSSQFTEKSDVYSFGVVLVELLTGQKPISFDKTEEERGLATRFLTCMEHNCLDTILDPQVSEQGRKEEVTIVARLAQRCLHLKGKMRPTMKEVANELESLRISQMSTIANNETEDVSGFEGIPMTISDGAYTWTGSYNSVAGSLSSDTHPLTFATM